MGSTLKTCTSHLSGEIRPACGRSILDGPPKHKPDEGHLAPGQPQSPEEARVPAVLESLLSVDS